MKLVHGYGVNDADYVISKKINDKRVMCHAYYAWKSMLRRCYSKKLHDKFHTYDAWKSMLRRCYSKKLHDKFHTYIGASVCGEWRSFMAFRKWWLENHIDGWHLDKDLLTDNREYSPENCIYIPVWLNLFTTDSGSSRGKWPIGVYLNKQDNCFRACCSNQINGRREFLGNFNSPDEAHNAWVNRKLKLALELKVKIDDVDFRLYPRIVEIIKAAR